MSPTFRRPVSRRRFLSRSLSGAAALGTFAAPTIRTTLASANERIGVAVIGFNGMGRCTVRAESGDQAMAMQVHGLLQQHRQNLLSQMPQGGQMQSPMQPQLAAVSAVSPALP